MDLRIHLLVGQSIELLVPLVQHERVSLSIVVLNPPIY